MISDEIRHQEDQVKFLRCHAQKTGSWLDSLPIGRQFLAEGGESKVYLSEDGRFVVKVNDAGYFATWTEYFNSLVIHNLLFANSAYSLLGFIEVNEVLFAVVQQPSKCRSRRLS